MHQHRIVFTLQWSNNIYWNPLAIYSSLHGCRYLIIPDTTTTITSPVSPMSLRFRDDIARCSCKRPINVMNENLLLRITLHLSTTRWTHSSDKCNTHKYLKNWDFTSRHVSRWGPGNLRPYPPPPPPPPLRLKKPKKVLY